MRIPIILSILISTLLSGNVIDKGEPSYDVLKSEGNIEGYKAFADEKNKKEFLERKRKYNLFIQKKEKISLKDVISVQDINKQNLSNVYDINELSIKNNFLYKDDKRIGHGYVKKYFNNINSENPHIKEILEVNNGYVVGKVREYHPNGILKLEHELYENKKQGYEYSYDSKGILQKKTRYKDNIKNGETRIYNKYGGLTYIIPYTADKIHGLYQEFYNNGEVKNDGNYEKDVKNGEFNTYDSQGNLKRTGFYKNNKLLRETLYNNWNGKKVKEIMYGEKQTTINWYDYYGNNNETTIIKNKEKKRKKVKKSREKTSSSQILLEKNKKDHEGIK